VIKRILIGKPTRHIEMFNDSTIMYYSDVEKLYDMLPQILGEMNVNYKMLYISTNPRRIYKEDNSAYLAWHNHGTLDNIWHLNISPMPDYFYFDKNGYSGWSELVQHYDYDIDIDSIRDETQEFCDDYIVNNRSRVAQPQETFIPAEPYVLVLQQRQDDAVSQLAYIDNQSLLDSVTELYKDTEYRVVTKAHPLAEHAIYNKDAFTATGSVHKIIASATAVYTVNSGAGFEALLHGKRVFTAGACDYHWVTDVIKTDADLQTSIGLITQPVDRDKIIKFIHYCLNVHWMNVNNQASIERKLQRVIDEYR